MILAVFSTGLLIFGVVHYLPTDELLGFATLAIGMMLVGRISIKDRRVWQPILVGFLFRASLVLIHMYIIDLPGSGSDAIMFERGGWVRAQNGFWETFEYFKLGAQAYFWIIGVVYSVIGRSPMMIMGINVILGTSIIWNAYRTAKLLWGPRAGVIAAWWIALFPNLALNAALILREAFVAYFFSLAIYYFVRWTKYEGSTSIILSMVFVGLAASFHEGMFIAIPVIGVVAVWNSMKKSFSNMRAISAKPIFMILIVVITLGALLSSGWGQDFTNAYLTRSEIDEMTIRQEIASRDRAAYPASLTVNGAVDVLTKGPIRVFYFLFAPFPWMARDLIDLLGLLDSFLYAYFIFLVWRMRDFIRGDVSLKALVFVFVAIVAVFGMAVGNYGTAIRHRAKIVVIPIVLAAGYRDVRRSVSQRKRMRYTLDPVRAQR